MEKVRRKKFTLDSASIWFMRIQKMVTYFSKKRFQKIFERLKGRKLTKYMSGPFKDQFKKLPFPFRLEPYFVDRK